MTMDRDPSSQSAIGIGTRGSSMVSQNVRQKMLSNPRSCALAWPGCPFDMGRLQQWDLAIELRDLYRCAQPAWHGHELSR